MNTEEVNSEDVDSRSKPKRRRRRRWFLVVVAVLVAMRLTVLTNRRMALEIGPDTTVITGPLNADGAVNYVAYLNERNSKGVTPETNAAAVMIRVVGAFDHLAEKTCRLMGLEPDNSAEGRLLVSMNDFLSDSELDEEVEYDAQEHYEEARSRPWRQAEFPVVHEYIKANAKALDATVAAMDRPGWYWPLVSRKDPATFMSCGGAPYWLSDAAEVLAIRAMGRAGGDDLEGCMNELAAIHRLAGFLSREETIVMRAVGARIGKIACAAEFGLLSRRTFTAARARSYLGRLEAMTPRSSLIPVAGLERFIVLEVWIRSRWYVLFMTLHPKLAYTICMLSDLNGGGPRSSVRSAYDRWLLTGPVDDNMILRRINSAFESLVSAVEIPDFRRRQEALAKLERQADALSDKLIPTPIVTLTFARLVGRPGQGTINEYLADLQPVLVNMSVQGIKSMDRSEMTARISERIVRCGLRLQLYRAEQGRFPADAKAAGAIMPAGKLPADPFDPDGGTLVYRRQGDGYILYSRGENETDDGGAEDDYNRQGDIVLRVGAATTQPAETPATGEK